MEQRETDPVRQHSGKAATRRLDEERLARIREFAAAPASEVSRHLYTLDKQWDIERRLEANAATIMLASVALAATHSKGWLVLSAIVPGFLLQHAAQGWCPPIEAFRRLGARSRNEIDAERTAIKALRGDFEGLSAQAGSPDAAARALEAAGTR
jgi:hypothetical protein